VEGQVVAWLCMVSRLCPVDEVDDFIAETKVVDSVVEEDCSAEDTFDERCFETDLCKTKASLRLYCIVIVFNLNYMKILPFKCFENELIRKGFREFCIYCINVSHF